MPCDFAWCLAFALIWHSVALHLYTIWSCGQSRKKDMALGCIDIYERAATVAVFSQVKDASFVQFSFVQLLWDGEVW